MHAYFQLVCRNMSVLVFILRIFAFNNGIFVLLIQLIFFKKYKVQSLFFLSYCLVKSFPLPRQECCLKFWISGLFIYHIRNFTILCFFFKLINPRKYIFQCQSPFCHLLSCLFKIHYNFVVGKCRDFWLKSDFAELQFVFSMSSQ